MDSGFQVLDYSLYQWNLDSVFQSLVGFWIPRAVFQSPGFQIRQKNFSQIPQSGFPYIGRREHEGFVWEFRQMIQEHKYSLRFV